MSDQFFELLKYTFPAFIVFLTVYYLFKIFLNQVYHVELMKQDKLHHKDITSLKLQAYERLMMFCERIQVDNLVYRLNNADMGVNELKNAMLIAIQQEYEHNLTQQLYVSDSLWQIISLARQQVQNAISMAEGGNISEFMVNVQKILHQEKIEPISHARSAVRNEAELLLK
jgi:hypothetical protein